MARIAVISGPDAGHALPAIGVGAGLVRRGHEVGLWSGREHTRTARTHGLRLAPLPRVATADPVDAAGDRLWGSAAAMAVPLARQLRSWRADLVVVDTLSMGGAFAAQLLDLAWVQLIPHHLADPADDLPPVGLGRRMPRTVLRRLDDRRIVAAQRRSVARGVAEAARAAAVIGLGSPRPPTIRLVATLPSLERPRAVWPSDAHVIGPLAVDPVLPELVPPDGDEPLVLVTDSTAPGIRGSIAEAALQGLRGLDLRVVVTSTRLRPRRRHRAVVGTGPHGPLLRGTDVAVAPGGGGFVAKAAAAGVPLVLVPLGGDQLEAAARYRDTGAGAVLPPRCLGPARLRWTVLRHLADRAAAAAAHRLADEAGRLGPDLAAALVDQVVAGRVPSAEGPREHLDGGGRVGPETGWPTLV